MCKHCYPLLTHCRIVRRNSKNKMALLLLFVNMPSHTEKSYNAAVTCTHWEIIHKLFATFFSKDVI